MLLYNITVINFKIMEIQLKKFGNSIGLVIPDQITKNLRSKIKSVLLYIV